MGKKNDKQENLKTVTLFGYDHFDIASTMVQVNVHVTVQLPADVYYWGDYSELENAIYAKAIEDKSFLTDIFPIDERYFQHLEIEGDDSYDRVVDESFITCRDGYDYRKFLWGGFKYVEVDGVEYKVALTVWRNWFEGEEHKN